MEGRGGTSRIQRGVRRQKRGPPGKLDGRNGAGSGVNFGTQTAPRAHSVELLALCPDTRSVHSRLDYIDSKKLFFDYIAVIISTLVT
jgi:hypothetical protein